MLYKSFNPVFAYKKSVCTFSVIIKPMKIDKKLLIFVVVLTFVALGLRLINIGDAALWIDELYCYDIALKPSVIEILKTVLLTDLHAPLFFIILHFWIKLFGGSDTVLIMLPVIFSTLSVPVGFIICKKLFDTKTAVVFSILNTFNALEIYYAQELKFYSLLPLLGLLSFYFFLKITRDFNIKNALWLLFVNTVIIYTFNAGIFFVFSEFTAGLAFILFKRKENLKNYFYSFVFTGILYVPYFYFQIKTMLGLNKSICTLFDIFHFDLGFVFTLIQNFFTPSITNLSNNPVNYNPVEMIKTTGSLGFVFYIVLFSAVALYGVYRAISEKNKNASLILSVSVLFVLILIILAQIHIIPLVTRYTLLVHLALLTIFAYGIAGIKNTKTLWFVTCLLVFISLFSFLFYKDSPLKRNSSFHYYSARALEQAGAGDGDIIVMPYFGRFLYKYFDKGQLVDYRSEELLLMSDAFLMKETFGLSQEEYNNKDKSTLKLQKYLENPEPPKELEKYFKDNYLSKLKKGQKLYLVENYNIYIVPDELYLPMLKGVNIDKQNLTELERSARYALLYTKILKNLETLFSRNLRPVRVYNSENQDVKIFEFVNEK